MQPSKEPTLAVTIRTVLSAVLIAPAANHCGAMEECSA